MLDLTGDHVGFLVIGITLGVMIGLTVMVQFGVKFGEETDHRKRPAF